MVRENHPVLCHCDSLMHCIASMVAPVDLMNIFLDGIMSGNVLLQKKDSFLKYKTYDESKRACSVAHVKLKPQIGIGTILSFREFYLAQSFPTNG